MEKLRKFDTKVQYLKYKVLREVAKQEWQGTLQQNLLDIPAIVVPGDEPTMRCCVYKERAILAERIKLAMGGCINGAGCLTHGDEKNKSLVEKYGKAAEDKTINDVVSKL